MVDLNAISDIIDLFLYFPTVQKTWKHKSSDIHQVLQSDEKTLTEDSALRHELNLIYASVSQKFHSFSQAYRFFDTSGDNRIGFKEFTLALVNLKVKLSVAEQNHCFSTLAGEKGYISFEDFRYIMHERRKEKSLQAPLEVDNISRNTGQELTESNIKSYLQSLNSDELDSFLKHRRSNKNLDGGPFIFDKKAPLGQPRKGYSVPKEIKGDLSKSYGIPTYHNVD